MSVSPQSQAADPTLSINTRWKLQMNSSQMTVMIVIASCPTSPSVSRLLSCQQEVVVTQGS